VSDSKCDTEKAAYSLILRSIGGSQVDEVSRLKQILKICLRRFQFRCERVEKIGVPENPGVQEKAR